MQEDDEPTLHQRLEAAKRAAEAQGATPDEVGRAVLEELGRFNAEQAAAWRLGAH